jgi:signal transduction histidine kinase
VIKEFSRSVRARMVVFGTLVIIAFLLIAGFTFDKALRQSRIRELQRSAVQQLDTTCDLVSKTDVPHPLPSPRDSLLLIQMIDPANRVVSSSANVMDMDRPFVDPTEFPTSTTVKATWRTNIDGGRYLLIGRLASAQVDAPSIYVAAPLSDVDRLSNSLRRQLLWWSPAFLAATALGLWLVVGRSLRPVDRMRQQVDLIEASDLTARVAEPRSRDEVGKLAATMNQMLGRLQRSADNQGRFVSDASHELRTPLAVMRTRLEVGLRNPDSTDWPNTAKRVLDQNIRMERLVANLLTLAKGGAAEVRNEAVDLDECVRSEVTNQRDLGSRLTFDLSRLSAGRVAGDSDQITRVVQNLLDNATKYARERIHVSLSTHEAWVQLEVEDDGPGISAEERERVFDRFTRLDTSRALVSGGTGLGLAIARDVVVRHGGTIEFVEPGALGGARAVVRLPVLIS